MQATIIYFFFLITSGFAQETSLPDPADNTVLDVKKLPSAEENPSPNPDDGDISDNVEDLQRKLIAERIKNRDLNQTISDILEEMEDMKKNIMRNEEKITDNELSVFLLTRNVEENSDDITSLGLRGHWCGYRYLWETGPGTITYERITYSDSNMNTGTPLDINTGMNSHKLLLSGY